MSLDELALELFNRNCRNYDDPHGAYYIEHNGDYKDYDGYYIYEIELHCLTARVSAKSIERDADGNTIKYDIKSVEWRDS